MNARRKMTFFSALLGLAAIAAAQTVSVSVTKIWDDADDQDGIKPEFLRLTLTADGVAKESATISAATGWAAAWKDLPALDGEKAIEYDVREDVVPPGYSISSVMRSGGGGGDVSVTITDTHVPELTTITAQKIWDDANDQDGKRPSTLVLSLYADGVKQFDATLSEANGWAVAWEDLPACGGGLPIAYEVREDAVPEGYSLVSVVSDGNAWTFTDRHEPATSTVSATKIWDDADDQDGLRPAELRLTLEADGVAKESATISAATGWAAAWEGLPAFDAGKAIEYDVREDIVPPGYSISSVMRSGGGGGDVSITITDTHVPELTTISAQKIWDDANDQDGLRPATLVLSLYADGAKQFDATLSEANGWAAAWEDLPACGGGLPIAYEVREDAEPEGYSLVSVVNNGNVWTFTDRHEPATATVSATKIWDDADDQDGLRPAELRLTLVADGVDKGSATLSAATGWAAAWEGLPAFDAGKAIEYDVREDIVPPGYSISSVMKSGGAGEDLSVTITDTHVPAGPPELKVTAAWTLDRSTGLIGGTLVLSNGGESPIAPDFDYWLATPGSRPEWHLWDSTGRMPDAADWFDLTAAVRAALVQTGNHDAAFDPGESVAVAAPRVHHRRRVSPAQYLDVQATVHAGRLFHVSDADRDFVLSDAELAAAQAAWSAGKLADADLLEATRLHGGAAYQWDDALKNWDTLPVDLR